ncbi:MAG: hypothetical protein IT334_06650, partial [Thermomicrobiales bacterium]|nr:hypothetical protein [Thermomicrobiales bacterium]
MPDQVTELNESQDDRVAWSPSPAYLQRSRLKRFIEHRGMASLPELQAWSEQDPGGYWDAAVKELGLEFSRGYDRALDRSNGIPWARWFEGGAFNYVTNALDRWIDAGRGD